MIVAGKVPRPSNLRSAIPSRKRRGDVPAGRGEVGRTLPAWGYDARGESSGRLDGDEGRVLLSTAAWKPSAELWKQTMPAKRY